MSQPAIGFQMLQLYEQIVRWNGGMNLAAVLQVAQTKYA